MLMKNNLSLADLHTHILPEFDDGAKTAEESVKMLLAEIRQGVTDVALTPHFSLAGTSVEDFIAKRDVSFKLLKEKLKENAMENKINLHLGAEVKYDPNLVYCDVFKLCIGETAYLLLELDQSYPFNLEQTVDWLLAKGITPIFAHVERYKYLVKNEKLMQKFLYEGVIFQANASSLLGKHYAKDVKKLIKKGYVQLLASDAHGAQERPPVLKNGIESVPKFSAVLSENSIKVIRNELI